MNLKRAHYLVTLAKHLNFTRAAAELYIAQSALSQQIKVLERELGVSLIERTGKKIRLTPGGEVAVREAEHLLGASNRASARIRRAAAGAESPLSIALANSWVGGEVSRAIGEFRTRHPGVAVTERRGSTAQNMESIGVCKVDVVVVRPPVSDDRVRLWEVDSEAVLLAVPESHPLAARGIVSRADLADLPVVMRTRADSPGVYSRIVESLWPSVGPDVVRVEADDEMLMRAVADGVGVAPMPAGRAEVYRLPGTVLRPIGGAPVLLPVAFGVRDDNANPAAQLFADLLDELFSEW